MHVGIGVVARTDLTCSVAAGYVHALTDLVLALLCSASLAELSASRAQTIGPACLI